MSDLKIHSIKYNVIMNIILKTSAIIFPMITFPYVTRTLQAEMNGKIAFAASVTDYFVSVASLGIPTYGIRICAAVRNDKNKLSRTVQELLIINGFFLMISYIIFLLFMFTVEKLHENSVLLWIFSLKFLLSVLGVEWFYQAIEQYGYITYRNMAFKVLSILLMLMFVHGPADYLKYAGIMVCASVGSNFMNLIRLRKYIYMKPTGKYHVKQHIMPVIILFLNTIATQIYTNLDTVMLGFMRESAEVGYYSAAVKVKSLLCGIITALGAVLLPRISYYIKNKEESKISDLIDKSFSYVFILAVPITCFFVKESYSAILILAGEGYINSVAAMKIIMPTTIFVGISSITGWQLLVPYGKEKYIVMASLIGGITDAVINFLLIPQFGAAGAAFGTLIAEIVIVMLHFYFLKDIIGKMIDYFNILKIIFSGILSLILLVMVQNMIWVSNEFVLFVFSGFIYLIMYGSLLMVAKEKMMVFYIESLKRGKRKG